MTENDQECGFQTESAVKQMRYCRLQAGHRGAHAWDEEEEREPWRDKYEADVLRAAEENHIWLNAFSCIRPTDEFVLQVGRAVLQKLNNPENTHKSITGYLLGLDSQQDLVLRINKS